jgi:tetratricopeptide (TPR) repeat protein
MRMLVATTLLVCLAAGVLAQQSVEAPQTDSPERIDFLNQRVRRVESLRNTGDYQAAECALREWLVSEVAGTRTYAMVENSLADLLREEGRNVEARHIFSEVLSLPAAPPEYRTTAFLGLADADMHMRNFKTSIEEWNRGLDLARDQQNSILEADALRGLGVTWMKAGSAARAEPLLRHSLRLLETEKNAPLELAASLTAMAQYYLAEKKLSLAESAWARALQIDEAAFGEKHPQSAFVMEMLGEVYSQRGESGLAVQYSLRAVDVMRQWFGDESPVTAAALANLAVVEQRAHTLNDAAKHFDAAVRVLRHCEDLGPAFRKVMQQYVDVLKSLHRDQEAKALDNEVKSFRAN